MQLGGHELDGLLDPALEPSGLCRRDRLEPLVEDGLGQHGGGGGAVAGHVGGLAGDLLHHLRTHVLVVVVELDLLGHGHAVLGDGRAPKLFSMMTFRPFGPSVTFTASASVFTPAEDGVDAPAVELDFLGRHFESPLSPRTARMSSSRTITKVSPETVISLPAYLPYSTRSPVFTSSGVSLPSSRTFPCPSRRRRPPGASPWRCRG